MKILFPIFALFLLVSCTRTTLTKSDSYTDPAFGAKRISSFLVSAENMKLSEQEALEQEVAKSLGTYNVGTVLGRELYIPTRRYGDEEKRQIAIGTNTEAILLISPQGRDIHNIHTYPDRSSPRVRVGGYTGSSSGVGIGVGFPIGVGVDEGGFIGGTHFREPEAFYKAEIYLLPNFERIWIAEFSTRGPDGMSWTRLAERFGNEMVKKLNEDGLI